MKGTRFDIEVKGQVYRDVAIHGSGGIIAWKDGERAKARVDAEIANEPERERLLYLRDGRTIRVRAGDMIVLRATGGA